MLHYFAHPTIHDLEDQDLMIFQIKTKPNPKKSLFPLFRFPSSLTLEYLERLKL